MTDRNLRKSTLDASERRKQREEARQLLKDIKKRRAAYSDVIEATVAQLSGLEVVAEEDSESVFLEDDGESSADEYIDPLKAVKSPEAGVLQRKDSFVQRPTPSPGEWSTVNTFFPEGCVISPRRPILSSTTMDPDTYNRRFREIQLAVDGVDRKRAEISKDTVHIADKDVYHGELAKIREAAEDCQRKIFELICELDENVQVD